MKKIIVIVLFTFSLVSFAQEVDDTNSTKKIPNYSEDFEITNLSVNTIDSDFSVAYFRDNFIVFSSTREDESNRQKKWKGNNQRFLNFYKGEIDTNGDLISYENLTGEANSKFHESNAVFTKDYSKVYFTRNNFYLEKKGLSEKRKMKLAIYIADVDAAGKWHNIVPFPYNSKEYNNGHPTLSLDEKTMYFTSDMPGAIGKTDIFKVDITETGTFTVPVNLGGNVNTKGKEWYPFIAADGTLYFSSDYHDGLGKSDIFKTDSDELELAAIQNIGEPFNSNRDDFAFVLHDNLLEGYFSSNRPKGVGDDDIYYFRSNQKEEIVEEPEVEIICVNTIVGTVIDKSTNLPIAGSLVEIFNQKGDTLFSKKVRIDGKFYFETDCSATYIITANKSLYLDKEVIVTTTDVLDQEVDVTMDLTPEVVKRDGKIIIDIESIYFDFDDHRITPVAATELDKVIAFMDKYPKVIIEGGSHTDSRGRNAYNLALSKRRATSTVAYILRNGGYATSRIYAFGYGEEQLVNHCSNGVKCSDIEHSLNRRTEFVIKNPSVLEE